MITLENSGAEPTVLIVEDDEEIAYVLRFMLEREHFRVVHAADGRAAVAQIYSMEPPALVLLDLMLPYFDGIQIVGMLRNNPAWRTVPVMLLTARAQAATVARALDAGADDYITKPFQPVELMARIRRVMRPAA